ncbi:hypothetical protein [Kocuria rosea]|uniref:hypothetical protein n=1 Tax=Kocuria rosea TaxID=1275 RepID=UPI0030178800
MTRPDPATAERLLQQAEPHALEASLAVYFDSMTADHLDRVLRESTPEQVELLARLLHHRHAALVLEAAGDRLALDKALDDLDEVRRQLDRLRAEVTR